MKKKLRIAVCFMSLFFILLTGCTEKTDSSTPKGITELFLSSMKKGDYKKACTYAGTEFDEKTYEKSAELQKRLMKQVYGQMVYETGEETIREDKATVEVTIQNSNYIDLLNDAIYKTMKEDKDDTYTEDQFTKALKNSEKKKMRVLVNFRKEKDTWIFDGSNSQLYAAMLGYLSTEK